MRFTIPVALAGATLTAVAAFGGVSSAAPLTAVQRAGVPYCHHEDGSGQHLCLWDAKVQGNGHGCTYLVLDGRRLPLVAVGTGKHRSPRYHGPECLAMH